MPYCIRHHDKRVALLINSVAEKNNEYRCNVRRRFGVVFYVVGSGCDVVEVSAVDLGVV